MKQIPKDRLIVRESMTLSFRGSEFYGIELDELSLHEDLAREKFRRDMAHARRPSTPSAIALHLRNTQVSEDFARCIAEELAAAGPHVRRVAVIGLPRRGQKLLEAALGAHPGGYLHAHFGDYERAKEWLIPG